MWGRSVAVPSPGQFPGEPPFRPTWRPPPGRQGSDTASGTPRSRGGSPLPWLVAPRELRYPQCRMPGPRRVANERSESAPFRDPRIWAGLPATLWRQCGDCSVYSYPRRPFGAWTEARGWTQRGASRGELVPTVQRRACRAAAVDDNCTQVPSLSPVT